MNSNIRPSHIIAEQLADLRALKESSSKYAAADFACTFALSSLEHEEVELLKELRAAELIESEFEAEVVLDGDPVTPGYIHARFFGQFLVHIQDLVNALAQQLANASSSRGSIASSIISRNRLLLAPTFPSSYGARFTIQQPDNTSSQIELDFDVEVKRALDQVAAIIEDIADDNVVLFEMLTHPRVKKHYSDLISQLAKGGANVTFRTKSRPYGVRLSAQQARDREEWLSLLQKDEEIETFVGVLVGGSIETGRFELRVHDELIRGSVTQGAQGKMKGISLGAEVEVTVQTIKIFHEETTIEPRTSYTLTDIRTLNETSLFSQIEPT